MTSKKILVTGGAGYIGTHTILELLSSGYTVISADNFSNAPRNSFERIAQISGCQIENCEIDLCDAAAVDNLFSNHRGFEGVIHFAALKAVGESVSQPLHYYHNNIASLLNVLSMCAKYSVKRFIFSSSCSVYGNSTVLPVDEMTPMGKSESPYAFSKVVGERIVQDTVASVNLSAILLRYFNPVGAHPSGLLGEYPIHKPNNLIPVITQAASGITPPMTVHGNDYNTRDGSCIRDYVHVCDIARAHVLALQYLFELQKDNYCDVFNLGTGSGVSVLEAVAAFEKSTGTKVPLAIGPRRQGDVAAIYSNSAKAAQQLKWTPEYDLEAMMQSAWKWQQQLNHERN
ncbi:MAG: UDP-glucose 4-epimerase GalE [Flavobacteriales bacterium]|nr:UDP-glucose 4-epimerase GalE [Flavobacteriales bacterium]